MQSRKLLRQPAERSIVHLIEDSRSVEVTGGRDWVVVRLGESQRAEGNVTVRVRTDPDIWPTKRVPAVLSKLTRAVDQAARDLRLAADGAVVSAVGHGSPQGSDHAAAVSCGVSKQVSDLSWDSGRPRGYCIPFCLRFPFC